MQHIRRVSLALAAAVGLLGGCGEQALELEAPGEGLATTEQHLDEVGSRGREFWLAFPGNYTGTPTLTLFITGDTATTGTVQFPGFSTSFSVTPGAVTPVTLPASAQQSVTEGVESKGIRVTAGADVSVYGLNRIQYTTDAYLGLPSRSLGTEYVVLGFPSNGSWASQFSIVATEDGTTVTITPSTAVGSRPAGIPYTVALNRGQAYQGRTAGSGADVSGTIITSNRPVSVFGGNQCANVPSVSYFACDYLVEQLTPTSTWGRNFVTQPLATRRSGDTFRFVASTNATQISVNGTVVATLNRGQVHQRIISGAALITSNNPITVAQYSNGSSYDGVTSDPFMMLIPPYEQFATDYTVTTPSSGFATNFINVVVPAAAVGSLTLDGAIVAPSRFAPIGSTGFSGAQLAVGLGTHQLAAPLPFGAFMYGFDAYDSYGYPGGMALAPVATVSSVTLAPKTGTAQVNTQHCLTATVRDQNSNPLEGVRVDFAVTGANTRSGQANTTAAGTAQYCYTGTAGGNDAIRASVGTLADTAAFTWTSNTPPAVNAGPDVSGYVGGTLTLNGSATDADGDALTVAWSYTAPAGVTCTFGSPSSPVSTISCDGEGTITVTLTANDGRASASDTATVTLGLASKVTLCNLPRYTNQGTVNVCGWTITGASGAPVASAWLTVNGGAPISVTPGIYDGFFWNPLELAEGTYVIRFTVVDTLGNTSFRQTTVTVDQTAPVLTFISPLPNDVQPDPVVNVTFQVQDASPVTAVTGYSVTSQVGPGTNVVTQSVNFVNRGCSDLLIEATDAAGNKTEYRSQVCVAY
jgi:hypothetical protein